ncbi:hypothetical protein G3N96_34820 [Burkholderia sp. Se-20373]|uniref:hypothetical protein n=1 Tax=Burkholderia TaxID=32008 RepID=UPI0016237B9C|nr:MULTISPECIES: hypothetical protein [Burkholderia]MBN3750551.1 hypothetical protein [Burkholderia sp. Se-20373]
MRRIVAYGGRARLERNCSARERVEFGARFGMLVRQGRATVTASSAWRGVPSQLSM